MTNNNNIILVYGDKGTGRSTTAFAMEKWFDNAIVIDDNVVSRVTMIQLLDPEMSPDAVKIVVTDEENAKVLAAGLREDYSTVFTIHCGKA